jgi:hypothetical protein
VPRIVTRETRMPNAISPNDIIWTRAGDPIRVDKISPNSGGVVLDEDTSKIRDVTQNGIKNGLSVEERKAFHTVLSHTKNSDIHEEIRDLYKKIEDMKKSHVDPKLIKYLENELKFRIAQNQFKPEDYMEDPSILGF